MKRWLVVGEYGLLGLAIVLPMLLPGFILTLDLVFTPRLEPPSEITNTWPLFMFLHIINYIIPADVIEKILLVIGIVGAGIGAHYLFLSVFPRQTHQEYVKWGAYFAGIFYMINPFIYSRLMAGQWLVILGYALLPAFFWALLRLITAPSRRTAVQLGLFSSALCLVSLHHVGIMALVVSVAVAIVGFTVELPRKKIYMYGAMAGIGVIFVNCLWAIPALAGSTGASIGQFDERHFNAFQTVGTGVIGKIGEVIRLQGFWAEPLNLYRLPREVIPAWGLFMVILWVLVIYGVKTARSGMRMPLMILGVSSVLAIIIATTPIIEWVSGFIPLVAGYREPHKFINIVALFYALAGGAGVAGVLVFIARKRWSEFSSLAATVGMLLLPIILTPTMLWGGNGQLQPRHYPKDWQVMNDYLVKVGSNTSTLFLPWHQYMSFGFAGRIIATPAEKYFSVPMIASDDPELQGISPTVPNSKKQRIAQILKEKDLRALPQERVSYILLAKEYDYKKYDYIRDHKAVSLVRETDTLLLFKLEGGER